MLGVSNGFPVLIVETNIWALSRELMDSDKFQHKFSTRFWCEPFG